MRFLFSLLRINGLYMFGALLDHPKKALHERHLVYVMYMYRPLILNNMNIKCITFVSLY
jgi:hypothetical protein